MKKNYILICLMFSFMMSYAQSYDVLSYNLNGTPANGVNIKTNLPFTNGTQMITLHISGYNYGTKETISLDLVWYVYGAAFINSSISSSGGYTPEIFLTNNNGLVNIFINDKPYYQRFKITAFAKGIHEQSSWFEGWTTADEAMQGTQAVNLQYKNKFKGTVTNQGDLYSLGNVGIGTSDTEGYKLAVAGNMIAESVKVKLQNTWPDYVFSRSHQLPPLEEVEKYINEKGHLQGIPLEEEVKANGIDLGEMNAKLLQKIEELTLYIIDLKKEVNKLKTGRLQKTLR